MLHVGLSQPWATRRYNHIIGEVLIYRVAVAVLRLCRQKLLCEDELGGCLMVRHCVIPFVPHTCIPFDSVANGIALRYRHGTARYGTVPACLPERATKPPSAVQRSCCNVARCTATGRTDAPSALLHAVACNNALGASMRAVRCLTRSRRLCRRSCSSTRLIRSRFRRRYVVCYAVYVVLHVVCCIACCMLLCTLYVAVHVACFMLHCSSWRRAPCNG